MSELSYINNPWRQRIIWIIIYSVVLSTLVLGLYKFAEHLRTHSVPVGQITLNIPYTRYLVGEPITFTINNNFNSPVYITNQCPREPLSVYRYDNSQWVRIHDIAAEKECPDEERLEMVPANGSVSGSFVPWHNLFSQPGKYRVVVYVAYYNTLPYQDFEVIAAPAIPMPVNTSTQTKSSSSSQNQQTPTTQPRRQQPINREPNDD